MFLYLDKSKHFNCHQKHLQVFSSRENKSLTTGHFDRGPLGSSVKINLRLCMFSRKYVLHERKWPGAWELAMAKNVERAVKPRRQLARISVPMLSSRVRGFNSQAFLPMASICFSVSPSGTRCCLFYSRPLKYTHLFSLSACLLLPHTLAAYKSDTQCLPTRVPNKLGRLPRDSRRGKADSI